MRREWHKYIVFSAVSALMLMSCNDNEITEGVSRGQDSNVISLSGEIDQVAVTRVNDNGFCDRIGRMVEDDDWCAKWKTKEVSEWKARMMNTFLAGH